MADYNTRDGPMCVTGGHGGFPNYEPNYLGGPKECPSAAWAGEKLSGVVGRYASQHPNDDYEQPRGLW